MMPFVLLAALLCVLAAALLMRPLWWPRLRARKTADAAAAPRPSGGLAALLVVFVFVVAAGGYAGIGAPQRLALGPGTGSTPTAADEAAETDPAHAEAMAKVSAMVDKLAERVKAQPDDAQGWQMLGRAHSALGRHAQAVEAFAKAAQLRPADATLLVDYAFAMAMANGRSFAGEPSKLVERALMLEPNNPKALALAGTVAFDRKDYPGAVRHWEALAKLEPADGRFAQQIRSSIAEARQLAGMPPAALPLNDGATKPPAVATAAQVSGTVTLAPSLKGRVTPDDTVFVFARAVDGPRMPLAILRKQVKDLPLRFTLDDSMAMSPAATLSSARQIVVGARISKSGNAMPQSGDLQGLAEPVAVGASGLAIEINAEITR